ILDPTPAELSEYRFKQRQSRQEAERLAHIKNTPAITRDGQHIRLLANIERPADAAGAVDMGAVGVGLLRSEFLFMNRGGKLPGEDEQYAAYRRAVEGMQGLPVTIRTADIGADKLLDDAQPGGGAALRRLNPALGLRAIRWSLAEPEIFLTQVRAILRAAAHGAVNILIPMLAQLGEVRQALALIDKARAQLEARGVAHGPVRVGAMIEVPAAALMVRQFAQQFDFLSIGTNDLVQYTLAIDRTDEAVAHLYDPLHPAVLRLIADVIAEGAAQGKPVSICGEMAGDAAMTRLLLGMGLRHFSMHPSRLLAVKQEVLTADTEELEDWVAAVLASDNPASLLAAG
ncbi:MAG: phosphoenolpyruvate--protein phosphotransferase, partial [Ottowia sp.]|nr:phosphoenolpyruvate--protein phosphotransferase [Ottowia sp.]